MKKIVIGVMSQDKIRDRAISIAKGKYKPKKGEPKVWFPTLKSVAEVLNENNRELLKIIAETQPDSLSELAELSGRQKSNLSRTLKTMAQYGFVELKRIKTHVKPIAKATEFEIHAA